MLESSGKSYETRAAQLVDAMAVATTRLSDLSKAMEEHSGQVTGALRRFVERVGQIDVPPDLLKAKVNDIVGQLALAVELALKKMQGEQERISGLEKLIEQAASLMTKLTVDVAALQTEALTQREEIRRAMSTLRETIESASSVASTAVGVANQNLKAQQDLLQGFKTESAATLRTVQDHRAKIEANVKASTELLSQVHNSLVSLTRTVVEKLDGSR